MNAETIIAALKIDYTFKLKGAEYQLNLDEAEGGSDERDLMEQRGNINLIKQFLADLS